MKPPPFLLGTALLFWGWQSDFVSISAIMAILIEAARVIHRRWEFSDEDFARVWTFCSLLFLATAVYAFTANEGPSAFTGLFQDPSLGQQRRAGAASARTAAAMFRWLPMIFFPFLAAQVYSAREAIPLHTISLILSRRWRRAKLANAPLPPERIVDVGFPYFAGTLLAASVHPAEDQSFFWGLSALLAWALWSQRSRRFGLVIWVATILVVVGMGYSGQQQIGQLQTYLERWNASWLVRFLQRNTDASRTRTAIGSIGSLKLSSEIVIRVKPVTGPPPTYLREASYRTYRTPIWYVGGRRETFEGTVLEETPNSRSWRLVEEFRTNNFVANIACSIPGGEALLPLPTGSWYLTDLPAYVIKKNSLGAVLAQGPGLVVFDAHFGPGSTLDGPPAYEDYHAVSDEEIPALEQIVNELQLRHAAERSTQEALQVIKRYFDANFSYSLRQQPPRRNSTNVTALARFLRETRRGHCEYFATAATLLLRQAYIPARYAVGYYVHEHSGDKYVVRARDAHAWTLVWDEQLRRWVDFDPTPASWVEEESKFQSGFQWLSDLWSGLKYELARFRWGQSRIREYLLLLIVPGMLVLLYQIFFKRRKHLREAKGGGENDSWPGLDSEFYALEAALAARGAVRLPGEPLSHWLMRATESSALLELRTQLHTVMRLHYRHRFDPVGLNDSERVSLRVETRTCLSDLKRLIPNGEKKAPVATTGA